jgi:tetratricopeptide (TPR) repeat protein
LLIAPFKLSIDYGGSVIGWNVHLDDPYLWIGLLAILGWIAATGMAIVRKSAAALFALLALALTYGMIGNIVALIGTIFGERLIYLPSAFVLILLAMAVSKLSARPVALLLAIAVVSGAIRSVTYASRVSDRLRFYQMAHEEQPNSIRLYITLADEYLKRGMLPEAQDIAKQERQFMREYYQVWLQSGQIAMEMHQFDEARTYLQRATEMQPENTQGWLDLLARRQRQFFAQPPTSTPQTR